MKAEKSLEKRNRIMDEERKEGKDSDSSSDQTESD